MKALVYQAIGFTVACDADYGDALTTSAPEHVTCPECIAMRERVARANVILLQDEGPPDANRLHCG